MVFVIVGIFVLIIVGIVAFEVMSIKKAKRAAFVDLVKSGDVEKVRQALEKGADPSVRTDKGLTPLLVAVANNSEPMVQLLLEKGAQPDVADEKGWTPLHHAAFLGYAGIVGLLARRVTSIETTTPDSRSTPLTLAAREGWIEVVTALMEGGRKPNFEHEEAEGWTALSRAAYGGHADLVKFLIQNGADATFGNERTAMHMAAAGGHIPIVDILMEAGAPVNALRADGITPLMDAAGAGRFDMVELLIGQGGNAAAASDSGVTALILAAGQDDPEIARALVDAGADINAKAADGSTAMAIARRRRHEPMIRFLESRRARG